MELIAWAARLLHCLFSLFPQRRRIVLLSRQSARPFDFALLVPTLEERFPDCQIVWCCVREIGRMSVALMLRQLWLVATSELCLVDGYVPAISLPRRLRCRVVQLWHAPGAIKRFGYQSLDTPAGRSLRVARALRMHRGYDLVVAGMPGAVRAFSEAFDMPPDKIVPLGLPRIDYLCSERYASLRASRRARAERAMGEALRAARVAEPGSDRTVVLYAPTFRKSNADERWLEHSVAALSDALTTSGALVLVAGHPLEREDDDAACEGAPVAYVHGVSTIDLLHLADYVVTDYSTVAFEAGYARRRVLFFVPDIEEYRRSPGLNIDPIRELPTISFIDAGALARVVRGEAPYDVETFRAFMEDNARGVLEGSVERIADTLEGLLPSRKG